jgi:hypothetical protein
MDDYNDQVGQDIYGSEDPYLQNEALDLERAYDSGGAEYGDPAVIYLVVPLSSGTSTKAQTTFRCEIVDLSNPETEGADLVLDHTGNNVFVTNVSKTRPLLNSDSYLAVKIGERFVMSA